MKTYRIDLKYWNGTYGTLVITFDSEHSFDRWLDDQVYNKVIGFNEIDADGNVIGESIFKGIDLQVVSINDLKL